MKIILSRKGFDFGFGGYPSPVLPNGELISIPLNNELYYSGLKFSDNKTYYDLMSELYPRICLNGKWDVFNNSIKCHLDPDLKYDTIIRKQNWKPMFGQVDQAQSHLENQGVRENDIFLFFGLFQYTKIENKILIFDKDSKPFHCIWGYLQIGKIFKNDEIKNMENYHPHKEIKLLSKKNNTIYEASEKLTIIPNKAGGMVLNFSEKLILTKKGLKHTQWELPSFLRDLNISYHSNSKTYGFKDNYFQSASRGQEFVIEENEKVIEWFKDLIN
jgi:hypothetical protein